MNLVVDLQYFPSVILFKGLHSATHLVFEQYENFQKMSFRNRMMIAGAGGPILLTIPLRYGRNQKKLIRDVEIDPREAWQDNHWKTIVSCYSRSPWFEFYVDELNALYSRNFRHLIEWNLECFKWICAKLNLSFTVSLTDAWKENYEPGTWIDCRNEFSSLPKLEAKVTPVYSQVFEERTGFVPNLSILDLLFCEGKNASVILAS